MIKRSIVFLLLSTCMFAFPACTTKKTELGTVIILNGPSAAGKSSIIKAFQEKRTEPWLSVGIDNLFVAVLPPKFYLEDKPEHHLVMRGQATEDEQGKLFTLYFGDEGRKVIKGMHGAIAAYARAGNDVIVDYIMYEQSWLDDLKKSLQGLPVIFVGITAPLEIITQREILRKTSPEGHARSLHESVHKGWTYDLEINTGAVTPEQAADNISHYLEGRNLNV